MVKAEAAFPKILNIKESWLVTSPEPTPGIMKCYQRWVALSSNTTLFEASVEVLHYSVLCVPMDIVVCNPLVPSRLSSIAAKGGGTYYEY